MAAKRPAAPDVVGRVWQLHLQLQRGPEKRSAAVEGLCAIAGTEVGRAVLLDVAQAPVVEQLARSPATTRRRRQW